MRGPTLRQGVRCSLAGAAVALVFAASGSTSTPPARWVVAFPSDRDGTLGIWIAKPGRPGNTKLFSGTYPDPSPDGTKLLLHDDLRDLGQALIANASGGPKRGVAHKDVYSPLWSSDGKKIAFYTGSLWVVTVGDTDATRLAYDVGDYAWSPHGASLAFVSRPKPALWLRDPAGTVTELTRPGEPETSLPSWSPDGSRLVYAAGIPSDLYIQGRDGSRPTLLTRTPDLDESDPAWSPDGARIAYSVPAGNGEWDIAVVGADGSGVRHVTHTADADDSCPTWSPDGSRLAFARDGKQIYVVTASGGDPVQITHAPRGPGCPRWSPDGSWIAYEEKSSIEEIHPDGSGLRNVGAGTLLRWTSDGKLVLRRDKKVYTADADGTNAQLDAADRADSATAADGAIAFIAPRKYDVAVVPVHGGDADLLLTGNTPKFNLRWSPNGSTMGFVRKRARDAGDLVLLSVATKDVSVVARGVSHYEWSADGRELAYSVGRALFRADAEGGNARRVADHVGQWAWSPRGHVLALVERAAAGMPAQLYVAAEGEPPRLKAASIGGEDLADLSWSPDGRWIAYLRCRYPGRYGCVATAGEYPAADVEAVSSEGRRIQRLTDSFPYGGGNDAPVWIRTTARLTPPQVTHTVQLPGAQVATTIGTGTLSASGPDAALALLPTGAGYVPHGFVLRWQPGSAPRRIARDCGGITGLAIFGKRVATLSYSGETEPSSDAAFGGLNTPVASTLWVNVIGEGRKPLPEVPCDEFALKRIVVKASNDQLTVAGDGDALLYDTWETKGNTTRHVVWRRVGARSVRVAALHDRPPAMGAGDGIEDVQQGRILLLQGEGALVLLDSAGRPTRRLSGLKGIRAARLSGDGVLVATDRALRTYDADWRLLRTFPLHAGSSAAATLAGVSGDTAAYVAGTAVHLVDLTSGSDRVLALPRVTAPVSAVLDDAGLFISYAVAYTSPAGRLAFYPRALLSP